MPSPRVAIIEKHGGLLTWHHDLAEGFRQCGATVFPINLRVSTLSEFLEKRRRHGGPVQNTAIQARIARQLAACRPDLVIVLNRPGLPAATTTLWRAALPASAKIIGWLCDRWDALPSGEAPAFDGLYYFDSSCHAGMSVAYAGTAARLSPLPLAVNPQRFPFHEIPAKARRPSLVFAGNCTPDRLAALARLRTSGEPVEAYGPHSGDRLRPWRSRSYSARALSRLYATHLASLNLLQNGNTTHGLNLRAFETPCSGGIGLYPDVADLPACFEPGREILTYRTLDEIPDLMARLRREPQRADAIVAAGRRRVLAEHTYAHRAARMLRDFIA